MDPEAKARENIDSLLTAAGWAVQDRKDYDPGASLLPHAAEDEPTAVLARMRDAHTLGKAEKVTVHHIRNIRTNLSQGDRE